ncbi:MAG: hypothetical protein ACYC25_13960 [Paludibacter sp.]
MFFNTTKSEDIKVASMQGIETRISLLPDGYGYGSLSLPAYINPAIYIGYFNEKRIADCWTINSTIGLQNIDTKSPVWEIIENSTGGYGLGGNGMKNTYTMMLEVGVEPRWYWGYKSRSQLGLSHLNSGWYLSFPILFRATLLNTPEPLLKQGWTPNYFQGRATLTPTIGYRQSISKRWFLEGSVGLGVQADYGIFIYPTNVSRFYILSPNINPHCEIKAAYTFN